MLTASREDSKDGHLLLRDLSIDATRQSLVLSSLRLKMLPYEKLSTRRQANEKKAFVIVLENKA
jgi:hypothetical protein